MRQKVRAAKGRFATRPYSLAENTEKKQKKEKNASRRVAPHRSRSLSQPHRHHIRPRPVPTLTYHSHFCISYGPGFPPCHPILKYYRASCPPVSVRSLNLPPTQKKKKRRKEAVAHIVHKMVLLSAAGFKNCSLPLHSDASCDPMLARKRRPSRSVILRLR